MLTLHDQIRDEALRALDWIRRLKPGVEFRMELLREESTGLVGGFRILRKTGYQTWGEVEVKDLLA